MLARLTGIGRGVGPYVNDEDARGVDSPVVLFDIGNVLFCDPWETLLLTAEHGLADRYGLDRGRVAEIGTALWRRYSLTETTEKRYWEDLARALGVRVHADDVAALESALFRPNPHARQLLDSARDSGYRIGIASNNTTFWFAKQWSALGLDRYVDPKFVFVSHHWGVEKSSPGRGLLEIAAETVTPGRSLLIDDRPDNLTRAGQLGFRWCEYSMTPGSPLPILPAL
ncbi:HAD family hydrolase [Embleya sp. NPDC001921]